MREQPLILVADDDLDMRQMLATSMRAWGYDVEEFDDGAGLVRRLELALDERKSPDLVVSDIQMPGKTGLDVLHWVQRWLPGVPVIVATGFGDQRTHQRAKQLGAARLLDKPFDLADLRGEIERILQRGRPLAGTLTTSAGRLEQSC